MKKFALSFVMAAAILILAAVPKEAGAQTSRSISVISPNGGEILTKGNTYVLRWNSSNIDKVTIELTDSNNQIYPIASLVPNTGSYTWTIDKGNTANTQFKLSLIGYQTGVGQAFDSSDAYFTIPNPIYPGPTVSCSSGETTVTLGQPVRWTATYSGGLNYLGGPEQTPYFVWFGTDMYATGTSSPTLDITYSTLGDKFMSINYNTFARDSVYPYNIIGISTGQQCNSTVKVVGASSTLPSITVISPNGGETLQKGSLFPIRWSSNISASSSVSIDIKRCPSCSESVAYTQNTGTYQWLVDPVSPWLPTGQPGYQIMITGGDARGTASDTSDGYFNISTSSQILSQLDPSSPIARTVQISPSTATDGVVLGVFDLKSQTRDATLRSIKFKVWTSTSTVQSVFSSLRIKIGTNTYNPASISQNGTYAEVAFTNLSSPLPATQYVPIIMYGAVAADRNGRINGTKAAVNILTSNTTVYAEDSTRTQVPVAQNNLTSSDVTFVTSALKSITLNKSVISSSYHVGDTVPIRWTSVGVNNILINLLNYKGTSVVRLIASSTSSTGQYNWIVPPDINFNYDTIYTIAVSDASMPSVISKSGKIELLPNTTPIPAAIVSNAVATLGAPIISQNVTVAYPVSFSFVLSAGSNNSVYLGTAVDQITYSPFHFTSGSGYMTPRLNTISATPGVIAGDSLVSTIAGYYIIPAGSSRSFMISGSLSYMDATTNGVNAVRMAAIDYGMNSTSLHANSITSGLNNLSVSPVFANTTPGQPLSAKITIEGQKSYTYAVGQTNHFVWSGTGPAGTVYSSYSKANDVNKCGEGAWVANNAQGTSNTYLGSQWSGCVWTVTYVATNPSTGQSVQDSVTLTVTAPSVAPRITSLSPTSGPVGTLVTAYGSNFGSSNTVLFNGTISPVPSNGSSVQFTVPQNTPIDSYGVSVMNNSNNANSNTLIFAVTATAPTTSATTPRPVSPKSLILSGPTGSSYSVGSTIPIRWSSSGVNTVVIDLYDYKAATKIRNITTIPASGGSYDWVVPADIDFDYDNIYTLRISDADQPTLYGKSTKIELVPATTSYYYPQRYGAAIVNALTRLFGL